MQSASRQKYAPTNSRSRFGRSIVRTSTKRKGAKQMGRTFKRLTGEEKAKRQTLRGKHSRRARNSTTRTDGQNSGPILFFIEAQKTSNRMSRIQRCMHLSKWESCAKPWKGPRTPLPDQTTSQWQLYETHRTPLTQLYWTPTTKSGKWKHSTIIPIPKPGKPLESMSLTSISLTSNLCNILERIVVEGITWQLEDTGRTKARRYQVSKPASDRH